MRLLQFALDCLTRGGLVCFAFKRILQGGAVLPRLFAIQSRRSVASSCNGGTLVCCTISRPPSFSRHRLGLFAMQSPEICNHSPPGSASVEGSPQQDKSAQRPRPPDGTQIPAIFPLVWLSSRVCIPYQWYVCSAFAEAFQSFSLSIVPCSRCQSGRLCRACQAAVIRCPLKNPARNVEFLAKIAIK